MHFTESLVFLLFFLFLKTLCLGRCREKVNVPITKPYISFIGSQKYVGKTVISWSDKASDRYSNGSEIGTYRTATVTVDSDFFCATAITIQVSSLCSSLWLIIRVWIYLIWFWEWVQNTVVAVPGDQGNQAAALRIKGDKAMLYSVRILGSQDTLDDESGSHYFLKCYIEGNVDFIFGNAKSLYRVNNPFSLVH